MTRERWRAFGLKREVVMLSLARMADAFCNSVLIVLLPLYVVRIPKNTFFGQFPDETLIGFLLSLTGLMFALMQPAAASLSDRAGRRKPFIVCGLALLGASTLGFISVDSYRALVGLRVLQGFGIAFTIPTALDLISEYADADNVGGSMGVFTTARMMGFAVGPLIGGWLLESFSFEAAFIFGACGAFLSLMLVIVFVPETRSPAAPVHRPERAVDGPSPENGVTTLAPELPSVSEGGEADRAAEDPRSEKVRWILHQLYVLGACVFVVGFSISIMASVEPELNRRLSQTAVGFGLAFAMLTVARFLFQIPIGHLSDQIGRKKLIFAGLVALSPLATFQGLAPTTFWLSVDRFLLGVATAMVAAPAYAMVADRAVAGLRVRQMSIMTMSFGLGIAMGPLLSGALAGSLGFEAPFLVGGILAAVAALTFYLFIEESHPLMAARRV